jgi:serine/threonine-protein kinase HipA
MNQVITDNIDQLKDLCKAYDINPVEKGTGLELNISDEDNSLDLELALQVSEFFRLSEEKSIAIMDEVKAAVKSWRTIATKYGISRVEKEIKSLAFSVAED